MESFMVCMEFPFFVDNEIKAFWHETMRKIYFYRIPKNLHALEYTIKLKTKVEHQGIEGYIKYASESLINEYKKKT